MSEKAAASSSRHADTDFEIYADSARLKTDVRRHCTRLVNRAVLFLAFLSIARADFSDDRVPATPDILARILAAADRSGDPLRSTGDARSAYYLCTAQYIGECRAAFGTVHLAALGFTRSAERGSKNPARGHSFIVFLDESFAVRSFWRADFDCSALSVREGSKIYFGDQATFDYANLPKPTKLPGEDSSSYRVAIDGQLFVIPTWSANK